MINTSFKTIERIEMDVKGLFWTRQSEMIEELEELDYSVDEINYEYVVVTVEHNEDKGAYILYLGHANSTMWIERVRSMN